ncbi:TPA: hypothetical protein HA363_08190, partial [Candidatus Woesearchaeota archaeon]|nr:hypothetical protein [Candidatus Woesearchaeota archaeon]
IFKKSGYLTNQNLHGFEEAELGYRLIREGWGLKSLNIPGVKHYGHQENPYLILVKKWKRKYLNSQGELIKIFLSEKRIDLIIKNIRVSLLVILFWILLILSIVFNVAIVYIIINLIILAIYFFGKNIKQIPYKLFSWHIATLGLISGLLSTQIDPKSRIKYKIIKENEK